MQKLVVAWVELVGSAMSTDMGEHFERMREDGRELGLIEAQAIALAYAVETAGEASLAAVAVAGRIELARARFELERERRKVGGAS